MGLDIGDKTIGVALSDPLFISAQGLTTIDRVGIRKDTSKVVELATQNECSKIVCGLPLMLSGEDSPQTQKVRDFVKLLENKIMSMGLSKTISIILYDERYTTKMAEDVLMLQGKENSRKKGMNRKERKEHVDRLAAQLILQSYMEWEHNQKCF